MKYFPDGEEGFAKFAVNYLINYPARYSAPRFGEGRAFSARALGTYSCRYGEVNDVVFYARGGPRGGFLAPDNDEWK